MILRTFHRRFIPRRLRNHLDYHALLRSRTDPGEVLRQLPRGPALVLAPHSDDEVLGAGGSAALHVRRGERVEAFVVCDGRTGQAGDLDPEELVEIRERESGAAGRLIGFAELHFGRLDTAQRESRQCVVQHLCACLEALRPRIIYLPSPIDFHPEHALTNEILAQALLAGGPWPERIAAYEVWSPLLPNCLIDITEVLALKQRALACYASQMQRTNVDGAALGAAVFRGWMQADRPAVEAFRISSTQEYLELWQQLRWG